MIVFNKHQVIDLYGILGLNINIIINTLLLFCLNSRMMRYNIVQEDIQYMKEAVTQLGNIQIEKAVRKRFVNRTKFKVI